MGTNVTHINAIRTVFFLEKWLSCEIVHQEVWQILTDISKELTASIIMVMSKVRGNVRVYIAVG
jgi:hypothetical protein